jgi:hypothetical protein
VPSAGAAAQRRASQGGRPHPARRLARSPRLPPRKGARWTTAPPPPPHHAPSQRLRPRGKPHDAHRQEPAAGPPRGSRPPSPDPARAPAPPRPTRRPPCRRRRPQTQALRAAVRAAARTRAAPRARRPPRAAPRPRSPRERPRAPHPRRERTRAPLHPPQQTHAPPVRAGGRSSREALERHGAHKRLRVAQGAARRGRAGRRVRAEARAGRAGGGVGDRCAREAERGEAHFPRVIGAPARRGEA